MIYYKPEPGCSLSSAVHNAIALASVVHDTVELDVNSTKVYVAETHAEQVVRAWWRQRKQDQDDTRPTDATQAAGQAVVLAGSGEGSGSRGPAPSPDGAA